MLDADQIAHLPCPEIWATIRRIQKLDAPTKSDRSDYRENPGFVREKTPNVQENTVKKRENQKFIFF